LGNSISDKTITISTAPRTKRNDIGINNKIETDHNQWRPTLKNKQAKKIGGRQPPTHERIL
jgi:hypothetical protein